MRWVLDIDDTITHAPEFFRLLTGRSTDVEIILVTYRSDRGATEALLRSLGIRYDHLITSGDPETGVRPGQSLEDWKVETIHRWEPDVLFEDMPEVIHRIDGAVSVFMACDPLMREWIRDRLADGRGKP